ncbi:MAG: DUF72 domain-containing protein [Proteobacteria bacterium]|nr:DUF72 domain-containing protein [Pseudomonadota bacterium]
MEALPRMLVGYAARRAGVRSAGSKAGRRPKAGLVELQDTFWSTPRPAALRRWREGLPAALALSCRASQLITHDLDSGVYRGLYRGAPAAERARLADAGGLRATALIEQASRATEAACSALSAFAVVYDTPLGFSPTAEHRRRMGAFFSGFERAPGRLYVWEPHGVWSADEVEAICRELDLVPCFDPLAEDPMRPVALETVYCRLRAPDYHEGQIDRLVEWALNQPRSVLVFAGPQGERQARRFTATAISLGAGASLGLEQDAALDDSPELP